MSEIIDRRISFNGGEVSPWTDPRIDLDKYRSSCRVLENMRPTVYGGVFSRPGTVYVTDQPNAGTIGRVVSFEFSSDVNLILVFTREEFTVLTTGDTPAIPVMTNDTVDSIWSTAQDYTRGTWIRCVVVGFEGIYYCTADHTSGAFNTDLGAGLWVLTTAFKRATPYQSDELAELQFAQVNDLLFIAHPNHAPRIISRFANNDWTIEEIVQEWPALRDENITATTVSSSATTGTTTLQATADIFAAGHVGSRWVLVERRDEPFEQLKVDGSGGTESAALYVLGDWSCQVQAGNGTGTNWDVTAIVQRSYNKSNWETIRTLTASRIEQSGLISGTEIEPCWLRVAIINSTGAPPGGYFTVEATDANHYGIVEITGFTDANTVTAQVIFELASVNATEYWREGAWSDYRGWPRTVCLHEQRLMFGGNASQPQTIWGSVIDDYYNFRTGGLDDLGLAFTMSNRKANAIQWLVSQDDLLIGTAGDEGPLGSRETDKALTPTNAKVGKFTTTGSAFLQALPVQDVVIFVQRSRRKAWEMAFTFESDGYKSNDLTLLAEHIADGQITGIALQRNPEALLWCVTGNGELIGLVYERAQQVTGWCRYVTDGLFESVAVVGGSGEEDQIWVTVNRDGDRFIERFQPDRLRILKDAEGADMVANQSLVCSSDCSVIYDGAATTTITGLDHLEGREVSVLADGGVIEGLTVSSGEIELEEEASVVIVGLPFTATLQPTWHETNDPASISKIGRKRITRATIEFWRSLGAEYSSDGGTTWDRVEFRDIEDLMDQAVPLFGGLVNVACEANSEQQNAIMLRQTQPLPLNILSLHIRYDLNIEA